MEGMEKERVLIVEDEAFVALELEITLSERGYTVIGPATKVQQALDMLKETSVDGVVLDAMLGRDEAYPVADYLVEQGIPFIFHSGHADVEKTHGRYGVPVHTKPTLVDRLIDSLSKEMDTNLLK